MRLNSYINSRKRVEFADNEAINTEEEMIKKMLKELSEDLSRSLALVEQNNSHSIISPLGAIFLACKPLGPCSNSNVTS